MNNKKLKKQVNESFKRFDVDCKEVKKNYYNNELTDIDYLNLLLDFTNALNKQLTYELKSIINKIY